MFKTFRNFPRKRDAANANPQQPVINTFIIDGIADTSKGVWISPTRNQTTDDGTLHIGLMNPFGLAATTIIQSGNNCVPFNGGQKSEPCDAKCVECDCTTFEAQQNALLPPDTPTAFQWRATCVYTGDPTCASNCTCGIRCVATRNTGGPFGGEQTVSGDCPSQISSFNCTPPGVDPPDQVSTIIRAVERFLLDLDINSLSGIDPETITSATLRLPIKRKLDWM